MSNLHESKQYDLIDMFHDTSRYIDDVIIIDNNEFGKHIPDIRGSVNKYENSLISWTCLNINYPNFN